MTFREPKQVQSPAAAALIAQGLMVLLLTFYVNYIPFHLLTERHSIEAFSLEASAAYDDDHDDAHHHGHDEHHQSHLSSEHLIQILPKSASITLFVPVVPAVTAIVLDAPASLFRAASVEHIWPPGESPPEPSQPRAPPIA